MLCKQNLDGLEILTPFILDDLEAKEKLCNGSLRRSDDRRHRGWRLHTYLMACHNGQIKYVL